MRLGIDDILSAHGVGGSTLTQFFGDGSDGAFYPLPTTTNVQTTLGAASSLSPGYTNMTAFTASASVGVSAIQVYTTGAAIPLTMWLFDSSGNNLGSGTVTTVAGGWTSLTLPNPVLLTANSTYYIGFYFTGTGLNFMSISSAPQTISASGASFTFGASNLHYYANVNGWPGTGTSGTPATAIGLVSYAPGNYTFTSTQDGPPVVKQYTSINIPAGVTVTVSNRCKGLFLFSKGDVTINGKIDMTSKSPLLDPTTTPGYAAGLHVEQLIYPVGNNQYVPFPKGGQGGTGGQGGGSTSYGGLGGGAAGGSLGTWWGGGRGSGGGSGIAYVSNMGTGYGGGTTQPTYTGASYGGSGSTGSTPSGGGSNYWGGSLGYNTHGAGGAAFIYDSSTSYTLTLTSADGGAGEGSGGGGAGGMVWTVTTQYTVTPPAGCGGASATGTGGGLISIIAAGNITISSSGQLTSNGASGATGGTGNAYFNAGLSQTCISGGGGGGAGAGGGVIVVLYKGTYSNSGTMSVNGGAGGSGGTSTCPTGGSVGLVNGATGGTGLSGSILTYKLPAA